MKNEVKQEVIKNIVDAKKNGMSFDDFKVEYGWNDWMYEFLDNNDPNYEPSQIELNEIEVFLFYLWNHYPSNIVFNSFGDELDFYSVVTLMDYDICDKVHFDIAPCTDQEFYDAYCKAHEEKFGEVFEPDKFNGQW